MEASDFSPEYEDSGQESESHEIIVEIASVKGKLRLQVIQTLLEPCDRKTYGDRLASAAQQLGCSIRTVQRLVKKWEEEGLAAFAQSGRVDTGTHRIGEEWVKFIVESWNKGKSTPAQVAVKVKAKAKAEGKTKYPSHMTVYRVLAPRIAEKQQKTNIRSVGWRGSRLQLKTRDGESLAVEYSNQVWQIDHTQADILLVDHKGVLLSRPWLTTVIDTYSRCIVGLNLGFDAPSSSVVALALRHAILPKKYNSEYKLYVDWPTCGTPEYIFTDGGKDFRSKHLEQIGVQLGFTCYLRDRPSEGGIVERPFGTFNTEFFSTLPGYTGSNVQERPKDAETEACLTLRELDQLFVAYVVNRYNRGLDACMGDQTRVGRWEAGLFKTPVEIPERQLDICLMKQTSRTIGRGGYIQFENWSYQNDALAGYAGEKVVLRYDPRDITTVLVYRREIERTASEYEPSEQNLQWIKEIFLAPAYIQDLYIQDWENKQLSLDESKAISQSIRARGNAVSHDSMLDELRDREAFLDQSKKTRRDRQQEEQACIRPKPQKKTVLPRPELASQPEIQEVEKVEVPLTIVWDFDED